MARRILVALSALLLPLLPGCGGREDDPPLRLEAEQNAPQCPRPTGHYSATFTLKESVGSCGKAKTESHDAFDFDGQGNYVSPVEGVITCQTAQAGCHLVVRCTTELLKDARGDLDAQVAMDASEVNGTGTVTGSYQGCEKLVYDLHATRAATPASP